MNNSLNVVYLPFVDRKKTVNGCKNAINILGVYAIPKLKDIGFINHAVKNEDCYTTSTFSF